MNKLKFQSMGKSMTPAALTTSSARRIPSRLARLSLITAQRPMSSKPYTIRQYTIRDGGRIPVLEVLSARGMTRYSVITAVTTASRTNLSMILARPGGGSRRRTPGRDSMPPAILNGSLHPPDDISIPEGIPPTVASGTLPVATGSIMVRLGETSTRMVIAGVIHHKCWVMLRRRRALSLFSIPRR